MPSNVHKSWEEFLDPAILRPRLMSASIFIAAFESLKSTIVDRVRGFFWCGFDEQGDKFDPKYETDVLSRNSSPVYASLDWLFANGAIDRPDVGEFDQAKACRNKLAHKLLDLLGNEGLPADLQHRFEGMVALLRKIELWWIINVEIPTDPDFDGKDIDEGGIVPGRIITLRLLLDIAFGDEHESRQYLHHFQRNIRSAEKKT